jgi:hypothetical protein
MIGVATFLLLGGLLQLWAGVATMRRQGELRTTQARQLEAAFGRKGAAAFFLILGGFLLGGGLFLLLRATL